MNGPGPEPGVRVARFETVDELVEAVMGLAAEDLAAGRTADADSAANLAAAYLLNFLFSAEL